MFANFSLLCADAIKSLTNCVRRRRTLSRLVIPLRYPGYAVRTAIKIRRGVLRSLNVRPCASICLPHPSFTFFPGALLGRENTDPMYPNQLFLRSVETNGPLSQLTSTCTQGKLLLTPLPFVCSALRFKAADASSTEHERRGRG